MRLGLIGLLAALFCCSPPPSGIQASAVSVPLPPRVTGANLRASGDAKHGYGTATARRTLIRLQGFGVNTVGVLYEGRMDGLGSSEIHAADLATERRTEAALRDASALGLATVLIPHLILDDGKWRGELRDRDAAFWSSYKTWIATAAEIAARGGATVLSLGVELKGLSDRPEAAIEMRALATSVRKIYPGLLTYNANWDEAEGVRFWDAVDLVGVNAYYPLVPDPIRGAEAVARRLTRLALFAEREVLVLEVGFRSSPLCHLEPWQWPDEVEPIVDEKAQANAWAAVLSEWLGAPQVRGLMIWVISTDPGDPSGEPAHGFSPLGKEAESVIRQSFGGPDRG